MRFLGILCPGTLCPMLHFWWLFVRGLYARGLYGRGLHVLCCPKWGPNVRGLYVRGLFFTWIHAYHVIFIQLWRYQLTAHMIKKKFTLFSTFSAYSSKNVFISGIFKKKDKLHCWLDNLYIWPLIFIKEI